MQFVRITTINDGAARDGWGYPFPMIEDVHQIGMRQSSTFRSSSYSSDEKTSFSQRTPSHIFINALNEISLNQNESLASYYWYFSDFCNVMFTCSRNQQK
jgi:hypothetical protein